MSILLKVIYRSNTIPYEDSHGILFLKRYRKKKNLKICLELQNILNSQSDPEKEEQSEKHHTYPHFKLYYKAPVIKPVRYSIKKDTQPNGTKL